MLLTSEEREFLKRLTTSGNPGCVTTRAEDRARQRCKRLGWVTFDRKAWMWRITDSGRIAINGQNL